jgi:hypothetical protein
VLLSDLYIIGTVLVYVGSAAQGNKHAVIYSSAIFTDHPLIVLLLEKKAPANKPISESTIMSVCSP